MMYSLTMSEQIQHVQYVLTRLQLIINQLHVNVEKCGFQTTSTTFLGYHISQKGVEMDQTQVTTTTDWPPPTTVKYL